MSARSTWNTTKGLISRAPKMEKNENVSVAIFKQAMPENFPKMVIDMKP